MRPSNARRRPVIGQRGSGRQDTAGVLALGRKHRPDYWLVILCAALLSIGLVVVYAISPALAQASHVSTSHYVGKQFLAISLSIVAFIATAQVPLSVWRQFAKPLLIIAGVATLLALALPVNPAYPAHRWVRLGGSLSFQSVEIVKFAVLLALAGFFTDRIARGWLDDFNKTLKPLLIAVLVAGIFIAGPQKLHAQSDLGSMAVLIAIVGAMCFVAGLPLKRLAMVVAVLAVGAALVILPSQYRRERLATFVHPESDCQDAGYQACQALIAVGSGGMVGLGLGRSVQAYGYLPEAANDSIFAIYAEKFGFIGCVILLGLLAAFFSRIKTVAERAPDDFSRLVVCGVLAWLSVQAIINIGAMIGLLPLKGITLPLISYGGTSVVFVAAAVGLVFQVSRYTTYTAPSGTINDRKGNQRHENRHDGRRLRGAYHPDPSGRA
ncbi:MAG: putative peptidoglycan glycosyltransferase FtsW [Patescibacteria group bacterium]|nr:putative peptidoglycan glycosyltransferase FtsW [Patescibacteria group bacterium]